MTLTPFTSLRLTFVHLGILLALFTLPACQSEAGLPTSPEARSGAAVIAGDATTARRRPVHAIYDQSANLNGTVLDAVTGTPVFNADVVIGGKTYHADSDGTFTIENLPKGSLTVIFSRWGYESTEKVLTLATGSNSVEARLTPKPIVSVTDTAGQTHPIDVELSNFATQAVLSTYEILAPAEFCRSDGSLVYYDKTEIRAVIGPATDVPGGGCCPQGGNALKVKLETKSGESLDVLLRECVYYRYNFIGRNRTTGKWEYFDFRNIARIEFP